MREVALRPLGVDAHHQLHVLRRHVGQYRYTAAGVRFGASASTSARPSRQFGQRGSKPSSLRIFALEFPRSDVPIITAYWPASIRTSQAGRCRGLPAPTSRASWGSTRSRSPDDRR